MLTERTPRRVVVAGTDADLAAVLLRLLRTDRLGVEVAYLPAERSPATTRVGAAHRGRGRSSSRWPGPRRPFRSSGTTAAGCWWAAGRSATIRGECYCDETLVLRGRARRLVVTPGPRGIAVRAGWGGRAPRRAGTSGAAARAPRGAGSAVGRAVQVGCAPATVVADGVPHPRPVPRWTWYRHTADWLLVMR